MNQNPSPETDRILYAQALQIAIINSGKKLMLSGGNDLLTESSLRAYDEEAKSILRYLRGR